MFTWKVCLRVAIVDVRKRELSVRLKEPQKWKWVRNERKNSSNGDDNDDDDDDGNDDESILKTEHTETIT